MPPEAVVYIEMTEGINWILLAQVVDTVVSSQLWVVQSDDWPYYIHKAILPTVSNTTSHSAVCDASALVS